MSEDFKPVIGSICFGRGDRAGVTENELGMTKVLQSQSTIIGKLEAELTALRELVREINSIKYDCFGKSYWTKIQEILNRPEVRALLAEKEGE